MRARWNIFNKLDFLIKLYMQRVGHKVKSLLQPPRNPLKLIVFLCARNILFNLNYLKFMQHFEDSCMTAEKWAHSPKSIHICEYNSYIMKPKYICTHILQPNYVHQKCIKNLFGYDSCRSNIWNSSIKMKPKTNPMFWNCNFLS